MVDTSSKLPLLSLNHLCPCSKLPQWFTVFCKPLNKKCCKSIEINRSFGTKYNTVNLLIDPFHATGLALFSFQRFSGVFRGYWKKPLACNGLMIGKNIDISNKIMRKISTQISVTFLSIRALKYSSKHCCYITNHPTFQSLPC